MQKKRGIKVFLSWFPNASWHKTGKNMVLNTKSYKKLYTEGKKVLIIYTEGLLIPLDKGIPAKQAFTLH